MVPHTLAEDLDRFSCDGAEAPGFAPEHVPKDLERFALRIGDRTHGNGGGEWQTMENNVCLNRTAVKAFFLRRGDA